MGDAVAASLHPFSPSLLVHPFIYPSVHPRICSLMYMSFRMLILSSYFYPSNPESSCQSFHCICSSCALLAAVRPVFFTDSSPRWCMHPSTNPSINSASLIFHPCIPCVRSPLLSGLSSLLSLDLFGARISDAGLASLKSECDKPSALR